MVGYGSKNGLTKDSCLKVIGLYVQSLLIINIIGVWELRGEEAV